MNINKTTKKYLIEKIDLDSRTKRISQGLEKYQHVVDVLGSFVYLFKNEKKLSKEIYNRLGRKPNKISVFLNEEELTFSFKFGDELKYKSGDSIEEETVKEEIMNTIYNVSPSKEIKKYFWKAFYESDLDNNFSASAHFVLDTKIFKL